MVKMRHTSVFAVAEVSSKSEGHRNKTFVCRKPESNSGWVILFWQPVSLDAWWRNMTPTLMHRELCFIVIHLCFTRVKFAGHRTPPGRSLKSTAERRTVTGRAVADVIIQRHLMVPVRFVTTQGKMLKCVRYPGIFFISPVICKALRSYGNNFICDYIMAYANVVLYSLYELTLISLRHFNSITLTQTTPLKASELFNLPVIC